SRCRIKNCVSGLASGAAVDCRKNSCMVKNEGLQIGFPTKSARYFRRKIMGRLFVKTTAMSFRSSPNRNSKSAATCRRKGSFLIRQPAFLIHHYTHTLSRWACPFPEGVIDNQLPV